MGVSRHWNWTGAEPLTTNVAQVGVAPVTHVRASPGTLGLFYVSTDKEMFNAQQRLSGDSTTWEVQPELSSAALSMPHGYVYARQFAVAGTDLYVLDTSFVATRYRQSGFGMAWLKVDPQPFEGEKVTQLAAALDSEGRVQLVAIRQDGLIVRQRQCDSTNPDWLPLVIEDSRSAYLVEIAANPNFGGLLEIFYLDRHNVISHMRQLDKTKDVNGWDTGGPLKKDKPTAYGFVVGQNKSNRLELFGTDLKSNLFHIWQTSTTDTSQWSDLTHFAGSSLAQQVTVAPNEDGRLEMFYIGKDGSTFHNWQAEPDGDWTVETLFPALSAKAVAVARNGGTVSSGRLELFWIDDNNVLQHSLQNVANSGWINTNRGAPDVPGSFGGSRNLFLTSGDCGLLTDVAVTIGIGKDLTYSTNNSPINGLISTKGFAWQLNCAGRADDLAVLQQYVVHYDGEHIACQVNNWMADPANTQLNGITPLIQTNNVNLVKLPGKTIPAGYQFVITLNNDGLGNVESATFVAIDPDGTTVGRHTIVIDDNVYHSYNKKASIVGPIVCMQVNLVGPSSGESVNFTAGAGSITYIASSILTAQIAGPGCAAFTHTLTGETSNSAYGGMSSSPSNVLQQSFSINLGGVPEILREDRRFSATPAD